MGIDGILNVNKPEGKTSFDVVAWLRRVTGERRVGHAGTLDPIATGVLPVCFGQGTRVVQFLADSSKTYLAQIELGVTTDTFDREGKVTQRGETDDVTVDQIRGALANFCGVIEQVPPIYSALKYHGRRYYELARAGIPIEPKSRKVEITGLELIDCQLPLVTVKLECGKGTYIRSLAHDLGQYLGCGAYLKNLTRLQYGHFHIEDALDLPQIEDAFGQGALEGLFYPIDIPFSGWRTAIVDKKNEAAIRNGQSLSLGEECWTSGECCCAYSHDGRFIAVLRFISDRKLWHPEKVFFV